MMLVDICQWRAAIGCFRASTQRSVRFHCALTLVSMLLQVFRLCKFACSFIFICAIILPVTIAIQFFVGHLLYPYALFLPLFTLTYSPPGYSRIWSLSFPKDSSYLVLPVPIEIGIKLASFGLYISSHRLFASLYI